VSARNFGARHLNLLILKLKIMHNPQSGMEEIGKDKREEEEGRESEERKNRGRELPMYEFAKNKTNRIA
jgi:hypothetical protein